MESGALHKWSREFAMLFIHISDLHCPMCLEHLPPGKIYVYNMILYVADDDKLINLRSTDKTFLSRPYLKCF